MPDHQHPSARLAQLPDRRPRVSGPSRSSPTSSAAATSGPERQAGRDDGLADSRGALRELPLSNSTDRPHPRPPRCRAPPGPRALRSGSTSSSTAAQLVDSATLAARSARSRRRSGKAVPTGFRLLEITLRIAPIAAGPGLLQGSAQRGEASGGRRPSPSHLALLFALGAHVELPVGSRNGSSRRDAHPGPSGVLGWATVAAATWRVSVGSRSSS